MKLGIVGNAADKFTKHTKLLAKLCIRQALHKYKPGLVISGGCHLGGVDAWAVEEASKVDIPTREYLPVRRCWEGGYKQRNLEIARNSDLVLVIVVEKLPDEYRGMRFSGCYHCGDRNPPHVKSGACWTAWRAKKRVWVII